MLCMENFRDHRNIELALYNIIAFRLKSFTLTQPINKPVPTTLTTEPYPPQGRGYYKTTTTNTNIAQPATRRRQSLNTPTNSMSETVEINPLTQRPFSKDYYQTNEKRQQLPAWQAREEFIRLVATNQILIIVGETGSGKTTQLPQFLIQAGYHILDGAEKIIVCTQPRQVAAITVAQRVAKEMDVYMGTYVGYSVRFDDTTSSNIDLIGMLSSFSSMNLHDFLLIIFPF